MVYRSNLWDYVSCLLPHKEHRYNDRPNGVILYMQDMGKGPFKNVFQVTYFSNTHILT